MSRVSPWQQPQRSSRLEVALADLSPEALHPHLPSGETVQTLHARPLLWGTPCREQPQNPRQALEFKLTKALEAGSTEEFKLFQEKADERSKLWQRAWILQETSLEKQGRWSQEGVTVPARLGFVPGNPESVCCLIYWSASCRSWECICDSRPTTPSSPILWQTDR